ncbi:SMI1/KNR4 family protein [Pseudovibrio ascidiaceicola]|uniref:SMI1/KNR4 family protein n=1 Tax=Pseudovibrio ascidiaceicola TaxID=285279 RepID=UPI003D35E639
MQRLFFQFERENLDVASIEEWAKKRFGVGLPEDFLFFLRNNGIGGNPIPCRFEDKIGMDRIKIEEFLRLAPPDNMLSVQFSTDRAISEGWMSDNLIMFAEGGGSHLSFVLAVKGPHRGKVFAFVDSGVYLDGDQIRLENGALHLANTFSEFIDGLYADEDDIDDWEDSMDYLPDEIKEKFGSGS